MSRNDQIENNCGEMDADEEALFSSVVRENKNVKFN